MPIFTVALFIIAKTWKQPTCPLIDEWIKKTWCVCVCVCVFSHEKKEILSFATICMDFDGMSLTEISQTEKNKCHMISTVYGILRKKEFINTKNRLVVAEGVKWGWVKQMKVVKRYKFPVISQSWECNARHD